MRSFFIPGRSGEGENSPCESHQSIEFPPSLPTSKKASPCCIATADILHVGKENFLRRFTVRTPSGAIRLSRHFDQKIRIVCQGSPFPYLGGTRTKVLRRLENIVTAYRLRKPAALPSPYFLRALRRKQLLTVYCSLTLHLDQKLAENEPFLTCFRLFSILFALK